MSMALIPALAVPVLLHIAPSPTENNRYAKLLLRHDALRIAYTVYFGERPGAGERRKMDRDGDGTIDEAEQQAFARAVADEVGPLVKVEVDGVPARAGWTVTDVGLGTPSASGGSFSVDLALEAALPPGDEHTLWLEDTWPIPDPGESEVRVETAPGVALLASHPGREGKGILSHYTWKGTALTTMTVRFRTDASKGQAAPLEASEPARRRWIWWVVGVAAIAAVAATALARRRG